MTFTLVLFFILIILILYSQKDYFYHQFLPPTATLIATATQSENCKFGSFSKFGNCQCEKGSKEGVKLKVAPLTQHPSAGGKTCNMVCKKMGGSYDPGFFDYVGRKVNQESCRISQKCDCN